MEFFSRSHSPPPITLTPPALGPTPTAASLQQDSLQWPFRKFLFLDLLPRSDFPDSCFLTTQVFPLPAQSACTSNSALAFNVPLLPSSLLIATSRVRVGFSLEKSRASRCSGPGILPAHFKCPHAAFYPPRCSALKRQHQFGGARSLNFPSHSRLMIFFFFISCFLFR